MTAPGAAPARRLARWLLSVVILATAVAVLWNVRDRNSSVPVATAPLALVELLRSDLTLIDGRLCRVATSNAFTGLLVERHPDGTLRSRTQVMNGLLNGLSEGWYTNGQRQVTEYFTNGVSHGLRVKWHPAGRKASEARIVDGKLHGRFVSWHDNGVKAAEVEFKHGQPDGISSAYFPSGALKSQVTMRDGTAIERKDWKDGELARVDPSQSPGR